MHDLRLTILTIFFFTPLFLLAKATPEEGSRLNYRIIGFSFPEKKEAQKCTLQIAEGNYNDDKSFAQHILVTVAAKKNRAIAEVPDFGKQYTWRVVYDVAGGKQTAGSLSHFSTMMSPEVDPNSTRMRTTLSPEKYKDHYVFVDGNKVLYDMYGKPVWFFPKIENHITTTIHLRDLKSTRFGTITAIVNGRLYEISYTGNILWRGPANKEASLDTTRPDGGYHHEFERLANGHYMAMGFEEPYWQLPGPPDSSVYQLWASKFKREKNVYYQKMFFSTILEYDTKGSLVWKWSDADYFKTSDLRNRMLSSRIFDINDTHANAFYFDDREKALYISYRTINRILEVHYPDRKVLHTYGSRYVQGNVQNSFLLNGAFCGQHSCRVSSDGHLYVFNNNIGKRSALPSIVMLKKPQPGKDTIEKIWEFECPMDAEDQPVKPGIFYFGGNVLELPDGSFFVCMGGVYGKILIVNRDKKVLWSAQPEKWDAASKQWMKDGVMIDNKMKEGCYRANIISREQLESIIWNEPMKK